MRKLNSHCLKYILAAAPLVLTTTAAHAQNSVTLYGTIDTGLDFASNEVQGSNGKIVPSSGGKIFQMAAGVPASSKWGLKGVEDLGGGTKVIFKLESYFSSANGSLGGDGNQLWSHNAYIGLKNDTYGTVTAGKVWDSIVDMVEPFSLNGNYGGYYFAHPNDMDNMDNGFSINNAVKYASPDFHGFHVEGHYSFGGQSGQFSDQSTWSAAASYASGNFATAVGYLRVNTPELAVYGYQSGGGFVNAVYGNALDSARSQDIFAAGVSYQVGDVKLLGDFTNTVFQGGDEGRDVTFQNYELSAIWCPTASLVFAGGYTFTTGRDHATDGTPKYQQLNLLAQYDLSKRTDVYLMSALQRASGAAQFAQIAGFNPSDGDKQAVVRVGITHQF